MKLNKLEKIQLVYDSVGAFFCAILLGVACALFVNPSSNSQTERSGWENFHFFLPFVTYFIFIYFFWKSSALKVFRLSFLWILINVFCPTATLFISFFIRDIVNQRFLTENSRFLPFDFFLTIVGVACIWLLVCASIFWFFGLIHRILHENRNNQLPLDLKNL
jgi:cytochrome bd-type quinol oxidase subunit 2